VSDLKLFRVQSTAAQEIPGEAVELERSLQKLIEQNLETLLGVRFLATEYSTGPKHGGRIDTLGIDENGVPVIIEYKRSINENVINQGLFYLDWLLDHQSEFWKLVLEQYGQDAAEEIAWTGPRLLCIAGDFTRYDEHAVQQINRNIELLRYRMFGEDLLLLELVNATTATGELQGAAESTGGGHGKAISETLAELEGDLRELYDLVHDHLASLGDDVQVKPLKYYVAFKRLKNFACVEVHTMKECVTCFLKVDPDSMDVSGQDFLRDVRDVGHYGTGDLEVTLESRDDFERAKPLFRASYENS